MTLLLVLLIACEPTKIPVGDTGGDAPADSDSAPATDTHDTVDSASDSGSTPETGTDTATVDCEALPDLPVEADQYSGFTTAEDFAFTRDGLVVSVDAYGNLVAIAMDGTQTLLRPGVGSTAGTRILPDGDVVVANVGEGSVQRISLTDGGITTLASGFPYPNGLDLGLDGLIYVADTNQGRLYQIDPDSGETTEVARGLYSPNGVALSPDGETLYVGSFGGGAVYAIGRDGEGFERPRVFGLTPDSPGVPEDACGTLDVGDDCMLTSGTGVGTCQADDDGDYCELVLDTAACEALVEGDSCVTSLLGEPLDSLCSTASSGELYCPRADAARVTACDGRTAYQRCSMDGTRGYCYPSWEGGNICVGDTELYDFYEDGCEGLSEGDACVAPVPTGAIAGVCADGSMYGFEGLTCMPPAWTAAGGGLDGIGVDACGQVYVAEYVTGKVMRFSAEGAEAELVTRLRSSWIPNLHWGPGAGGFASDVMYVADREGGTIFGVNVGVPGRPELYP